MKKLALCLLMVAAGSALFADDATVLPQGVGRLRVIPSMTSLDESYDSSGKTSKASPTIQVYSLNAALEFGLTDAFTLGLKWAPGYKLASSVDNLPSAVSSNKKMQFTGPEDLEIGLKVQVLGAAGLVKSDKFRVAFTPGVSLPLDSFDAKTEFDNFLSGKDYRVLGASAHGAAGFGLRSDFDWVVTEAFSINLHNQVVQYLPREQMEFATYATNAGLIQYLVQSPVGLDGVTANPLQGNYPGALTAANTYAPLTKTKTEWGLTYTIEAEPKYEFDLGNHASLTLGLPVTYESHLKDKETYNGTTTEGDSEYTLTLKPGLDLFFLAGPLPLEVKADYARTVLGQNTNTSGTLAVQVMAYYKFY